jgi:outer membrane protein assembly factor BamB
MEEGGSSFDEFSLEMGNFDINKVKKFDRMWRVEEGGSLTTGIALQDGVLYFASANRNIYAVNSDNGELVWKFQTEAPIVGGTPVVRNGLLFLGSYDRNMYAIRIADGTLFWKFTASDKIGSAPTYDNGMVFFGSKDHNLYAIDAKNGEMVWKYKTYDTIWSKPLAVDGKVFVGSYDHFIYCIGQKTGRLIWKLETQGEIHNDNQFGYKDGIVYCGSFDNNLRAIDANTGRVIWKKRLRILGMANSSIIYKDKIFQSTRDGIIYALSMKGDLLWKHSVNEEDVISWAQIHNGRIYIGSCGDYNLHCISMEGKEIWRFKTFSYVYDTIVSQGNNIIFASWDCNIYCIDADTKRVSWKFKVDGSPAYVPPPHEAFELNVDVSEEEVEETAKKDYGIEFREEERDTSEYKPVVTYQSGKTYRQKGKYQIDSRSEEF